MTKAVMETAAEKYRRIRAEKESAETLHDVECPSGMTFKCRRPTIAFWVTSGILPLHLVEMMTKASEKGVSAEDAFNSMPVREKLQSIEFAAKVVKYVCIEPRIVEHVVEPNDISQDEVMLDDFNYLVTWAMHGGDEAERLETFRKG